MTDSIWQILSHNGMEKRQQQKTKTEGVALNLVNLVIVTWKTLERIVLVVNQMQLIGFRVSTEWASEVGKHGSRDLRRWTKSAAVNTAREMGEWLLLCTRLLLKVIKCSKMRLMSSQQNSKNILIAIVLATLNWHILWLIYLNKAVKKWVIITLLSKGFMGN